MLMHLRMSVPDRPGMLAQITAALADVGADIRTIAVLERESGRAIDDIYLSWPEGRPASALSERLASVRGISVLGLAPVPPSTRRLPRHRPAVAGAGHRVARPRHIGRHGGAGLRRRLGSERQLRLGFARRAVRQRPRRRRDRAARTPRHQARGERARRRSAGRDATGAVRRGARVRPGRTAVVPSSRARTDPSRHRARGRPRPRRRRSGTASAV